MDNKGRIEADNVGRLIEFTIMNAFNGPETSPRGKATREQLGVSLVLTNSRNNILVSPKTKMNYRFMVAEWLWMMHGLNTVAPVARYNKRMLEFSDDGVTLAGAYGPKIMTQLPYVFKTLKEDPSSRQAVLTIWQTSPPKSKDIPCTVAAQFLRRGGQLHSIWTMRSSDAWLGLKYDVFCFSMVQNYLAGMLDMEPGFLQVNLGSSHIYSEHWGPALEFMGTADYVDSPLLTHPIPSLITACLVGADCGELPLIDQPWLRYGKVLTAKTNAEALEFLHEY